MKILVCSTNPVKIKAAEEAFYSYFKHLELISLDLNQFSGVYKQPMTAKETLESAVNRIEIAQKMEEADYYVSLEGGLMEDDFGTFLTWFVCVSNREGKKSIAGGGRMSLPRAIYKEIKENAEEELGDVIDRLAGETNTKRKGGATALFTGERIQRKEVFKRDIIIALVPFTSNIYKKIEKEKK
jgi:inosine/xanthosine triphosphatase